MVTKYIVIKQALSTYTICPHPSYFTFHSPLIHFVWFVPGTKIASWADVDVIVCMINELQSCYVFHVHLKTVIQSAT